jgi:YesN/AraC family two-component response regulator
MKNLLIVDDEEMLVDNIKFILAPCADKIFTANNGKEGLAILENETIHCVLSDITMPVMNGVEFIRNARMKNILTPFIFYSAYGDPETIREVSKFGVFDFLKKPNFIRIDELVTRAFQEGRKHGK